jgi:hypothetical protein
MTGPRAQAVVIEHIAKMNTKPVLRRMGLSFLPWVPVGAFGFECRSVSRDAGKS